MSDIFYQEEFDRLVKEEKKLERLISHASTSLAKTRAKREAIAKLIEQDSTGEADDFEQIFNQVKDQISDVDDSTIIQGGNPRKSFTILGQRPVLEQSGTIERTSRIPAETKTFKVLHLLQTSGNPGYYPKDIMRLIAASGIEGSEDITEQTLQNILSKQTSIKRIKRIASKVYLTEKGVAWLNEILGVEQQSLAEAFGEQVA